VAGAQQWGFEVHRDICRLPTRRGSGGFRGILQTAHRVPSYGICRDWTVELHVGATHFSEVPLFRNDRTLGRLSKVGTSVKSVNWSAKIRNSSNRTN
jgi:hypothetical protein